MMTNTLSAIRQLFLAGMMTALFSVLKKMVLTGLFFLCITGACLAAAPPPADPGDINPDAGAGDTSASSVPIDGGLSLLIAAGVGYGAKRIAKTRQKKAKDSGNIWDYAKP